MRLALTRAGGAGPVCGACTVGTGTGTGRTQALRAGRITLRDPEAMRAAGFDHSPIGRP